MVTTVTIKHPTITSDVAVRILCDNVIVAGKKNLVAKPNANVSGPVEAQTQSYENLKISIQGIHYTEAAGTLTRAHVLALYQATYDGTGAGSSGYATLNVTYDDKTLLGTEGSANIKVVLDSFNLPINSKDSRNAYLPIGSISLLETA